jgi:hypothetical protein
MSPEHVPDGRSEHDRSAQRADALPSARARTAGGSLPPVGGGGRGVGVDWYSLGVLRPFNPISWFHPRGIKRVLARLEPRLPDVSGCLFLTFTVNPLLYANPAAAFDDSRQQLRRIFYALRKGIPWEGRQIVIDAPYAVKVEFHKNEWAHFHVVFLTHRFLPAALLNTLWGLGRTNVQRITNEKFRYLLKYVTKGGTLPDWVQSRKRLRVFQASHGFYRVGVAPKKPKAEPCAKRWRRRSTESLGERIVRYQKTALFQTRSHFMHLHLAAPFGELHSQNLFSAAMEGRYLGNGHYTINDITEIDVWINKQNQTNPLP